VILENELVEKYIGIYEFQPDLFLTIFQEGDQLFIQRGDRTKAAMTTINKNTFDVFDYGIRLVFNLNENQNISELTLIKNGEFKIKKVK
jgi:hypothetical protein